MRRSNVIEVAEAPPEPDQLGTAPHPRDTRQLFGQAEAEATFLAALGSGRLHHGWMISGPKGIGKATLAWRIARKLLADPPAAVEDGLFGAPPPPTNLDVVEDHPVARRVAAGSEPGLLRLVRPYDEKTKRFKRDITVDEVRKLKSRFAFASTDGGWRVCIVDAADEMNTAAANAFLKLLEEPPDRATLLLVTHQPTALLPTIRSRCRLLRCAPLSDGDMQAALTQAGYDAPEDAPALTTLSGGSVGRAVALLDGNGTQLYAAIVSLLGSMPLLDRPRASALADTVTGRESETVLDLVLDLLDIALARLARCGALGGLPNAAAPQEMETFLRLAPTPHAARAWSTRAQEVMARARHGRAVNLDPGALILDTLFKLSELAGKTAR